MPSSPRNTDKFGKKDWTDREIDCANQAKSMKWLLTKIWAEERYNLYDTLDETEATPKNMLMTTYKITEIELYLNNA